ncbi:MAG: DNA-directed RNA polymerase subunit alpha C-terminal domain-containing protein [Candidatus Kapaibacteriota bacterium]
MPPRLQNRDPFLQRLSHRCHVPGRYPASATFRFPPPFLVFPGGGTTLVRLAAKILIEHIQFFLTFEIAEKPEVTTVGAISTETPESEHARLKRILSIPVDELEISVRAYNCLKANNIKTLGDIVSYTEQELLKLKNFGKKSLKELEEIVHQYGLEFGLNVERYLKPDKSSSKSNRDYGF